MADIFVNNATDYIRKIIESGDMSQQGWDVWDGNQNKNLRCISSWCCPNGDTVYIVADEKYGANNGNVTVNAQLDSGQVERVKDEIVNSLTVAMAASREKIEEKIDGIQLPKISFAKSDGKPKGKVVQESYSHGYKYTLYREEVENDEVRRSEKPERERTGEKGTLGRDERRAC